MLDYYHNGNTHTCVKNIILDMVLLCIFWSDPTEAEAEAVVEVDPQNA